MGGFEGERVVVFFCFFCLVMVVWKVGVFGGELDCVGVIMIVV